MTTKQKAIALATKLNVSLFRDGYNSIQADAPHGYIFETDLHSLVCEDWKDLYERLTQNTIEPCEDKECYTCHNEERMNINDYANWMNWELILDGGKF